jgi:hypothetical protein
MLMKMLSVAVSLMMVNNFLFQKSVNPFSSQPLSYNETLYV